MAVRDQRDQSVIHIRDLTKTYEMDGQSIEAVRGVSFTVERGEYVALMGPSGSGKSTLLNVLGCLDRPTSGTYHLGGRDVGELDDDRLAAMPGPYTPAVVLRTAKKADKLPTDLPPQTVVDYEAERDKRAEFFEIRKGLSKEAQTALGRKEEHPELEALRGKYPHRDWDIFRAINPPALDGYNALMSQWWAIRESLPEVLIR